MAASVFEFPRVALRHRDLLRSFVWRDLAARYEGSMLGRALPVIYPLLLLALYHLVFAQFLGLKFGEGVVMEEGWETTFYLLSGILPWLAFADTLARSTNVVLENSNLIKKIAFPSELLPTFVALAQMVHFLISAGLMVAFYLLALYLGWTGAGLGDALRLSTNLVYLPVPMVLQLVLALGLAMMLATANVFVRDLSQFVSILILLWMLVSPLFYPLWLVEQRVTVTGQTWMLTAIELNPIYHLLAMYRAVFRTEMVGFPWGSCAIFAAVAFVVFYLGHRFFVTCKGLFPDEV